MQAPSVSSPALATETWRDRLYTPTHLVSLHGFYFLVDCWHHRILWSRDCAPDLLPDTGMFAAIAQDFYLFELAPNGGLVRMVRIPLDFLARSYTRSFTCHDGHIYFVSGNGFIHQTELRGQTLRVLRKFAVPAQAHSMNDLWFAGGRVWLTASPRVLLSTESLEALDRGEHHSPYAELGFRGTPYYFSVCDGFWTVPEIIEYSAIRRFRLEPDGRLQPVLPLFDFGPPTPASHLRYEALPK